MYNVQELATAVHHRIPLVTILFNDNCFGNVKRIQEEDYGGRHIAIDLHNPDFVGLANNFGALGLCAGSPEELRLRIREAFDANSPTLIEVPIDALPSIWKLVKRPPTQGETPPR